MSWWAALRNSYAAKIRNHICFHYDKNFFKYVSLFFVFVLLTTAKIKLVS